MQQHARSQTSMQEFMDKLAQNRFNTPHDIQNIFPSADQLGGGLWVFDIAGNNYRVVARFENGRLVVDHAMTHAEYDRWNRSR
jgi:mRNA interferase HigB